MAQSIAATGASAAKGNGNPHYCKPARDRQCRYNVFAQIALIDRQPHNQSEDNRSQRHYEKGRVAATVLEVLKKADPEWAHVVRFGSEFHPPGVALAFFIPRHTRVPCAPIGPTAESIDLLVHGLGQGYRLSEGGEHMLGCDVLFGIESVV